MIRLTPTPKNRVLLLAAVSAIALAGCAKAPTPEEKYMSELVEQKNLLPATPEERETAKRLEPLAQAAFWNDEYDKNPGDYENALEFAKALQLINSHKRAAEITAQALALKPGDPALAMTYAKSALHEGRPDLAGSALEQAEPNVDNDWKFYSMIGICFDQVGDHANAQLRYMRALRISPDNPKVLSNLGLSQALSGDPAQAEKTLRRAVGLPEADAQIRQNLALVLGVQGKFEEAAKLSASDLPQTIVRENNDYYRSLLSQDRHWGALKDTEE
ncbi:MAG: hypothetical protein AAGB25_05775 [Pseudomonadota bacterium]